MESLEAQTLKILSSNREGISDDTLKAKLKNVSDSDRMEVLNSLIEKSRLEVSATPDNDIIYKYISEEDALKLRELTEEEKAIYSYINDSGNKGLWITDIKKKVGHAMAASASKIVKRLEKKGFIKSVPTVKAKNRKVWMVVGVEPSNDVTGGVLAEGVFDLGFMGK